MPQLQAQPQGSRNLVNATPPTQSSTNAAAYEAAHPFPPTPYAETKIEAPGPDRPRFVIYKDQNRCLPRTKPTPSTPPDPAPKRAKQPHNTTPPATASPASVASSKRRIPLNTRRFVRTSSIPTSRRTQSNSCS